MLAGLDPVDGDGAFDDRDRLVGPPPGLELPGGGLGGLASRSHAASPSRPWRAYCSSGGKPSTGRTHLILSRPPALQDFCRERHSMPFVSIRSTSAGANERALASPFQANEPLPHRSRASAPEAPAHRRQRDVPLSGKTPKRGDCADVRSRRRETAKTTRNRPRPAFSTRLHPAERRAASAALLQTPLTVPATAPAGSRGFQRSG